jgi:hypothetical protein
MEKFHEMPSSDDGHEPDMKSLLAALARARLKLKAIEMSGNFTGEEDYKYSTWADVCLALDPCLLPEGLIFVAKERLTVHGWIMVGRLYHAETGTYLESQAPIKDGGSNDPRDWLGACTYARKGLYLELGGGFSRNPFDGKQAAEEVAQPEQAEQAVTDEVALDAMRAKVAAGMKLLKTPDRIAEGLAKAEALVKEGRLRERDLKAIAKPYIDACKPNNKKEVANVG